MVTLGATAAAIDFVSWPGPACPCHLSRYVPVYVEAGTPGSPNWHKSNALKTMRARPELAGTLLAKGTRDYAIVDALAPRPGDIVIPKTRYSGTMDDVTFNSIFIRDWAD